MHTVIQIGSVVVIALVLIAAMTAVAVWVFKINGDACRDSPDGDHDYINERTPEGWRLVCFYCNRKTNGINAFHRQA